MRGVLLTVVIACAAHASAQFDLQRSLSYGFDALLANPALLQDHDWTIRTGAIGRSLHSAYAADAVGERSGNELRLSPALVKENVRDGSQIFVTSDVQTLGLNRRYARKQMGFHHAIRSEGQFDAPAGLLRLAGAGNANLLGESLQVLPQGDGFVYHELGIHYAQAAGNKVVIGGRIKVLGGVAGVTVGGQRAEFRTAPATFETSYDLDIELDAAGVDFDLNEDNFSTDVDIWQPTAGFGAALDLGIVIRPVRKIEVSLAATDLGAIRWHDRAKRHSAMGMGSFQGIVGNVFADDFAFGLDSVLTDLEETAQLRSRDRDFTSQLSPKLNSHIRYRLADATDLTFSLNAYNRLEWSFAAAAGIGQNFGDFLHVGGIVGFSESETIVGLRASLMLAGIKLYAACDNAAILYAFEKQRALHYQLGLSVNLRRIEGTGTRLGWFDDEPSGGRTTPDNYL